MVTYRVWTKLVKGLQAVHGERQLAIPDLDEIMRLLGEIESAYRSCTLIEPDEIGADCHEAFRGVAK